MAELGCGGGRALLGCEMAISGKPEDGGLCQAGEMAGFNRRGRWAAVGGGGIGLSWVGEGQ